MNIGEKLKKFWNDSFRELRHVVWPTRKQTQGYFIGVIIFIILFSVYLFIFGSLFSELVFGLKNGFSNIEASSTGEVVIPDINIISNEVDITDIKTENNSTSTGNNLPK